MEEEKAAAYYDELTRKGEGAAKFKQGLGFSSSSSSPPKRTSTSSLFSNFVRASAPKNPDQRQEQEDQNLHNNNNNANLLENIQNKLRKSLNRSNDDDGGRYSSSSKESRGCRDRYDDREREEGRYSRRSRDRESEHRGSRRRRSRSNSPSRVSRSGDRDRDRERHREREKGSGSHNRGSGSRSDRGVDCSKLIDGYSQMTPAERVKAKMKLQLSQTAAKDTTMGMSTGWERFDFNKDAPLDDDGDDEIEVAEDDKSLVKDIGRSFRFSAVEARREEEVKAAHDHAMFGGAAAAASPVHPPETIGSTMDEEEVTDTNVGNDESQQSNSALISDKVLSMQQGSWRDRARRFQNGSGKN